MKHPRYLAYRFNDAHFVLDRTQASLSQGEYLGPENAPEKPQVSETEAADTVVLWQPKKHCAALLNVPAGNDSEQWRDLLLDTFGSQAIDFSFLTASPSGGAVSTGGEKVMVLGHGPEDLKELNAFAETSGLKGGLWLPPYAPVLHRLALAGKTASEPTLILDMAKGNTLLLVVEKGGVREARVLPVGIELIGEAIRTILNLRFAGSGLRLLFNSGYDFASASDNIANSIAEALKPLILEVVPSLEAKLLPAVLLGLPPCGPDVMASLGRALNMRLMTVATDFGIKTTPEQAPLANKSSWLPAPLWAFEMPGAEPAAWLQLNLAKGATLDQISEITLKSVRLEQEEIVAFSAAAEPEKKSPAAAPQASQPAEPAPAPQQKQADAPEKKVSPVPPPVARPQAVKAPAKAPAETVRKQPEPTPQKKSLVPIIAAVAAVILVAIGGIFMFGGSDKPAQPAPAAVVEAPAKAPLVNDAPQSEPAAVPESPAVEVVVESQRTASEEPVEAVVFLLETPDASSEVAQADGAVASAGVELPVSAQTVESSVAVTVVEEVAQPEPVLPTPLGSVTIVSEPLGAKAWFNGEHVGQTPVVVPDLEFGNYALRVEMPDHEVYEASIEISQQAKNEVIIAKLALLRGSILIETQPAGFEVMLTSLAPASDLQFRGKTPFRVDEVPLGRFQAKIRRPGWEDTTTELVVNHGETSSFSYVYPEGTLVLSSTPAGVTVLDQNQNRLGQTPLELTGLQAERYRFQYMQEGFEARDFEVAVVAHETTRVHHELLDLNSTIASHLLDRMPQLLNAEAVQGIVEDSAADYSAFVATAIVTLDKFGKPIDVQPEGDQGRRVAKKLVRWAEDLRFESPLRQGVAVKTQVRVALVFFDGEAAFGAARNLRPYSPMVSSIGR